MFKIFLHLQKSITYKGTESIIIQCYFFIGRFEGRSWSREGIIIKYYIVNQKSSGNYWYMLYTVEEKIIYQMSESGEFPKLEWLLKLKVGRV